MEELGATLRDFYENPESHLTTADTLDKIQVFDSAL